MPRADALVGDLRASLQAAGLVVDYVELVAAQSLKPLAVVSGVALLAAAVRPGSIRRARASTGCTCASTARPSITTTLPFDDFGRICMRSTCESATERAMFTFPQLCGMYRISMFGASCYMSVPALFGASRGFFITLGCRVA